MNKIFSEYKKNYMNTGLMKYLSDNKGILIGFLLIIVTLSISSPYFLTTSNLLNIMKQISTNALLAFGMTFVIIIGGIDLSVGSIMAFSGIMTAGFIMDMEIPIILAVFCGVLFGGGLGLFNGIIIAKTKIPPFIVTLAMFSMARGGAFLYSDGRPIRVFIDNFNIIGNGFLGPIAYPVIYTIVIYIILNTLLNQTRFGRYVYAIGGNNEAALFSGIKIANITMIVYTLSGILAGISGVILTARMYTGQPSVGQGSELDAIAAVVLGGTSMSGGLGTLSGTLIGALIIGVINNGLNLLNVSSFIQLIVKGAVILLAVYIDTIKKKN